MDSHPWRTDLDFAGRLLPDYPDDLQVILHDGEPRRTGRQPELCWVRVQEAHGVLRMPAAPPNATAPVPPESVTWSERALYRGVLLNHPHQIPGIRQGASLVFVATPGLPAPLQVTDAYLRERSLWAITPCSTCGADQTLDPMSVMAQTRFCLGPDDGAPLMFTSFCVCSGIMALRMLDEGRFPELREPPIPGLSAQASGRPDAAPPGDACSKPAARRPWWRVW